MADLINQIREASIFGHFINHSISDIDMVTTGEQLILDTGLFPTQYAEWRRRDETDRTWMDFESYWTTEFDLWIETSRTASSIGMGYAGMAASTAEAEKAYLESLQTFGQTNQHNAETFNQMATTNAQLTNGLAASIQQMQSELRNLALAVSRQPAPPTFAPPGFSTNAIQAAPHQPYQAPPQPHTYQQTPQYQQYNQNTYQGRGRGGRGRGRGRVGRGRGGRGQQYYNPATPQNAGQTQTHYNTIDIAGGGFYGQFGNQAPNPVKYHKNWNYCWSHGFDVEDGHDSQSCPYPRPGHVHWATRTNPCNGCMKAKHKTQM
jgi:hypothetical protein